MFRIRNKKTGEVKVAYWATGGYFMTSDGENWVGVEINDYIPEPFDGPEKKDEHSKDTMERLIEILSSFFNLGDSYHYVLERVKSSRAMGTMSIDDFREYDEDDVAEIVELLIDVGCVIPMWIPIDRKLPNEGEGRVLVKVNRQNSDTKYDTDRYVDGNWVRWGDGVTHWRPIYGKERGHE